MWRRREESFCSSMWAVECSLISILLGLQLFVDQWDLSSEFWRAVVMVTKGREAFYDGREGFFMTHWNAGGWFENREGRSSLSVCVPSSKQQTENY